MLVLRNADFIITVDPGRRVITRGSVVVRDGTIVAVDKQEVIDRDYPQALPGAEVFDATNTLITPGFINTHVQDLAETRISELLQARLYTREAVVRLVDAVNMRLRARQPGVATERERVRAELYQVQQRFDSVRRFIEQGEGSAKVRGWLTELERDEARLQGTLRTLEAEADRPPLRVHPGKVEAYLADLHTTLLKGGVRVREVVQQDLERIVIHPVRPRAAKPFARAEVIASGKGLLDCVTFMVAGAGFEPATFWVMRGNAGRDGRQLLPISFLWNAAFRGSVWFKLGPVGRRSRTRHGQLTQDPLDSALRRPGVRAPPTGRRHPAAVYPSTGGCAIDDAGDRGLEQLAGDGITGAGRRPLHAPLVHAGAGKRALRTRHAGRGFHRPDAAGTAAAPR
jgi:hypothetical protein